MIKNCSGSAFESAIRIPGSCRANISSTSPIQVPNAPLSLDDSDRNGKKKGESPGRVDLGKRKTKRQAATKAAKKVQIVVARFSLTYVLLFECGTVSQKLRGTLCCYAYFDSSRRRVSLVRGL